MRQKRGQIAKSQGCSGALRNVSRPLSRVHWVKYQNRIQESKWLSTIGMYVDQRTKPLAD
jgi:hypothetical protein